MKWIERSLPGATATSPHGAYLRITHPLESGVPGAPGGMDVLPRDLLFFDLETLGFLGHPLFLVGLALWNRRRTRWEVRQFFARDYSEEESVLRAFGRSGASTCRWVSFNGKSFDLPCLQRRAAFHGVPLPRPREHLDLLHLARRLYRDVLPDCRLRTLEERLMRRFRTDDLPGGEIPAAYHAWVRNGDPGPIGQILAHNRDDLVTLAELYTLLECGLDAGVAG